MNRSLLFRLMSFVAVLFISSAANTNLQAQPPDLMAPVNGDLCVVEEALLDWDTQPGAISYSYQVSELADFSNILYEGLEIAETDVLLIFWPGTQYFWRAAANYPGPITNWSDPWSFTTINEPPDFIYPQNDDFCIPLTLNFNWNSVPTAVTYDLQVSANENFSTLIIDETGLGSTTYS